MPGGATRPCLGCLCGGPRLGCLRRGPRLGGLCGGTIGRLLGRSPRRGGSRLTGSLCQDRGQPLGFCLHLGDAPLFGRVLPRDLGLGLRRVRHQPLNPALGLLGRCLERCGRLHREGSLRLELDDLDPLGLESRTLTLELGLGVLQAAESGVLAPQGRADQVQPGREVLGRLGVEDDGQLPDVAGAVGVAGDPADELAARLDLGEQGL